MRAFWKSLLKTVLIPLLLLGMIPWSGEATAAQVDMTWVDNADNEAGFEIEQSIGPNGPFEWRDTVNEDVTSYTDSNLAPLTEYCYRVRAFNSAGASDYSNVDCQTTTGENGPPVADAGADQTVLLGDAVTLDGVGSTDPDGDPLTYCWDLGDGSAPQCSEIVTHAYTAVGTYTATLTVTDTGGLSDTDTTTITVTEESSSGSLAITNLSVASGQPYVVVDHGLTVGAPVYIDRSYTYSSVPAALEGATYIQPANADKNSRGEAFLSFTVNQDATVYVAHDERILDKPAWLAAFADTGVDLVTTDTTLRLFAHDFPMGTVILGGNDPNGNKNISMYTIVVVGFGGGTPPPSNDPPLAQASVNNPNVFVGDLVTLDGSGSTDPDGDPLTYCWDLGDGSAPQCSEIVTHAYTAVGTYTATLTVTDTGGLSDTDTTTITVTEESSSGSLAITNLSVASGQPYVVVDGGLTVGALVYIDRSYTYSSVPAALEGATYIQPANADKNSRGEAFLSFTVNQDATVYVAHDERILDKPAWLAAFVDTGVDLVTTDTTLRLFAHDFPMGTVILGGNDPNGNKNISMYTIVVVGFGGGTPPPSNDPPLAQASVDQANVNVGDAVTLDGSASTDPDGDPLTYCWDLRDGSAPQCSEIVTYAYTAAGTYTATLTVTDTGGLSATDTTTITVTDGSSPLQITNLSVASGQPYVVVDGGLTVGAPVYIDRSYTYSSVPAALEGATYIQPANADKNSRGEAFLSFTVNQDATVYVAHDERILDKPAWLAAFADTGVDLVTTDTTLRLFAHDFPAGTVTLGGNDPNGNRNISMYTIVVVSLD